MNEKLLRIFIKNLVAVFAAVGMGIASVAPLVDWDTVEFNWATLNPLVYPIARVAWLQYKAIMEAKNDPLP